MPPSKWVDTLKTFLSRCGGSGGGRRASPTTPEPACEPNLSDYMSSLSARHAVGGRTRNQNNGPLDRLRVGGRARLPSAAAASRRPSRVSKAPRAPGERGREQKSSHMGSRGEEKSATGGRRPASAPIALAPDKCTQHTTGRDGEGCVAPGSATRTPLGGTGGNLERRRAGSQDARAQPSVGGSGVLPEGQATPAQALSSRRALAACTSCSGNS